MTATNTTLIAFGGNLPYAGLEPQKVIRAALASLDAHGLPALKVSRFYQTPCFPAGAGPDYVNAAAMLDSGERDAGAVLDILHAIEAELGRERQVRWGGRTLDLDLLAQGDRVLPDAKTQTHWRNLPPDEQTRVGPDRLILPHPRMQDRAFVLVPLADIAPDWRHPLLGKTVAEMLGQLPDAEIAAIRTI